MSAPFDTLELVRSFEAAEVMQLEQLRLPIVLPEQRRIRDPVPESLVRQLLRWKRDRD